MLEYYEFVEMSIINRAALKETTSKHVQNLLYV